MVELSFEGVCDTKYNSGLSDKWNKLVSKLRLEERSFWLSTQLGIVQISKLLRTPNPVKVGRVSNFKQSLTSEVLFKPGLLIF